ncbi:MAG: CPBP family intramembrane metalloprotease [Myxococcota bacterium]|nr:CPBP family intramembrane metalloprotease [Myxococcota bacterium]
MLSELHPRRFFLDTWRTLDAESTAYRAGNPSNHTADAVIAAYIFSVVAVSLVLQGALGDDRTFSAIIRFIDTPSNREAHPIAYAMVEWLRPDQGSLSRYLHLTGTYRLVELCYWAAWRVFGFLIIPLLAMAPFATLRRQSMGLTLRGFSQHIGIYCVLFGIVIVPVFIVSFWESFNSYYPFYANAHRSVFDFVVWESFYIAQFFSLEFFFRGFMILPLRRAMGSSAIFAMTVPYVMIHIGKPLIECFAAVIAGIVLGTLALRTRSIWGGILIHVGVALFMDVLCIWQRHF